MIQRSFHCSGIYTKQKAFTQLTTAYKPVDMVQESPVKHSKVCTQGYLHLTGERTDLDSLVSLLVPLSEVIRVPIWPVPKVWMWQFCGIFMKSLKGYGFIIETLLSFQM